MIQAARQAATDLAVLSILEHLSNCAHVRVEADRLIVLDVGDQYGIGHFVACFERGQGRGRVRVEEENAIA